MYRVQSVIKTFLVPLSMLFFWQGSVSAQQTDSTRISYLLVDKDNAFAIESLQLSQAFSSELEARTYLNNLPITLLKSGFFAASIDSLWKQETVLFVQLYLGQKTNQFVLNTDSLEEEVKFNTSIFLRNIQSKTFDSASFRSLENMLLDYYGDHGYPFAIISLKDVRMASSALEASLKVDKGPLYKIDSIRIIGNADLSKAFLKQHLSIADNSIYVSKKLQSIDQKMQELPFVESMQASDVTMLGTGAVVNLYLQQKKTNQIDFLIGFLPNSIPGGKSQLTGDVKLDLKNLLGNGENFLFKWQSLQPRSPRLNIGFDQPYVFKSAFGLSFLFDLYKRDSNYRQVNARIGTQFKLRDKQIGKLFFSIQDNSILQGAIDTNQIRLTRILPADADVTSISAGFAYELANTNYKFNPRKGLEIQFTTSVGTKKIKVNNEIAQIKDPSFNFASLYDSINKSSYQLRMQMVGARYFPTGKRAVFKTGFNGGWFASPRVFRNELFLIGGFKLLRGFNEEAFFAKQYAVATLEYRYLTARNSHLFTFVDLAAAQNRFLNISVNNHFISAGVGIVNETKFGLLNLSFAAGKRNDLPFNIREAVKLHFGYVNFF